MGEHSDFSPSGYSRWSKCPGSIGLLKQHPRPENKYASRGTRIHEAAAAMLNGKFQIKDFKDLQKSGDLERATDCFQFVKGLREKFKCVADMAVEMKVAYDEDVYGTTDAVLYSAWGALHIIDFKSGVTYVDADGNEQLMTYALAAINTLDLEPEAVYLHIYQPDKEDGEKHREAVVTMKALQAFECELKVAVQAVKDNPTKFVCGDHCTWCNKAACPLWQTAIEKVQTNVEVIALPTSRLLELSAMRKNIVAMLEQADAILLQRAMAGDKVPGMKLVKVIGNRSWCADFDAKTAAETTGLAPGAFYETKVMTPPAFEKAHGKDAYKKIEKFVDRPVADFPRLVKEGANGEPWLPPSFADDIATDTTTDLLGDLE